ncbi:lactonase family protein [Granulicella cerasi]|uniref:Lactonase family protein n=1 Tax=Granulicella cerasi TaxID=741063 RepID=A0ABW1Z756_9BACT|nr:lactonase family protein [Granulicella cerasi]
MKFNKLGKIAMAAGMSLAMTLGFTACSRDYVAAYVYAPSYTNGKISAFAVDYQTGILTQVSGSPFTASWATGTSRVIASPDSKYLYAIGADQVAQVEVFSIGTDGKLYGVQTQDFSSLGTYATGSAMDSTGKFLYVTYRYQAGYGPSSYGPGGVSIYPIDTSTGKLGTPTNVALAYTPVGISVTVPVSYNGNSVFVYVAQQISQTTTSGIVTEYQQNRTTGALTAIGSIAAGVNPSFIITEPSARFTYVSDKTSNLIYGFQASSSGVLTSIVNNNYTTGLYPVSMTIDPRGKYLYVANYNASTVSGYTINASSGELGGIASSGSFTTQTGPNCVTVDPAIGNYLYTSNYLDNSISGAQLRSEDGTLTAVANSPFTGVTQPNCITSVANGSHADSYVYPK